MVSLFGWIFDRQRRLSISKNIDVWLRMFGINKGRSNDQNVICWSIMII
jgi:hypothetical protein